MKNFEKFSSTHDKLLQLEAKLQAHFTMKKPFLMVTTSQIKVISNSVFKKKSWQIKKTNTCIYRCLAVIVC